MSVATSARGRALLQVAEDTAVLTPNGDGVNDSVTLVYEIMEVAATASVRGEIRDLGGALCAAPARRATGHYGRDDAGRLLPPGVYLYRRSMVTDGDPHLWGRR